MLSAFISSVITGFLISIVIFFILPVFSEEGYNHQTAERSSLEVKAEQLKYHFLMK